MNTISLKYLVLYPLLSLNLIHCSFLFKQGWFFYRNTRIYKMTNESKIFCIMFFENPQIEYSNNRIFNVLGKLKITRGIQIKLLRKKNINIMYIIFFLSLNYYSTQKLFEWVLWNFHRDYLNYYFSITPRQKGTSIYNVSITKFQLTLLKIRRIN